MTRQEYRNEYAAELGDQAERIIQGELAAISRSLDGDRRAAVTAIDMALAMRLISGERRDILAEQAVRISFARKEQIELEGMNRG